MYGDKGYFPHKRRNPRWTEVRCDSQLKCLIRFILHVRLQSKRSLTHRNRKIERDSQTERETDRQTYKQTQGEGENQAIQLVCLLRIYA